MSDWLNEFPRKKISVGKAQSNFPRKKILKSLLESFRKPVLYPDVFS